MRTTFSLLAILAAFSGCTYPAMLSPTANQTSVVTTTTATITRVATFTPTFTVTSTATPLPTPTPTPTPTRTPTPTPSSTPTLTPSPTATPLPSPTPTLRPVSADDWQHLLLQLINRERTEYDLPPLAYNNQLALAAQRHAEDCAHRGYGSHIGSDGANLRQRLERVGYTKPWATESWAWARTPQHAVAMWLNEAPPDDPHRRMLLSRTLTEVGVGIASTKTGYYFIADFGR